MGMRDVANTADLEQRVNKIECWGQLEDELMKASHLPGPRANLALAGNFADLYARVEVSDTAWKLLVTWAAIKDCEAQTGDPREFLPFCAVCACGTYYGFAAEDHRDEIRQILRSAMNDSRWRMREAAAMTLQSIGERDFTLLKALLDHWRQQANPLEQRAFIAALAHPPLLKDNEVCLYSLILADEIMEGLRSSEEPGDAEHTKVLIKGLEYGLSVLAADAPEEGFALLRKYAESGDVRYIKIVKSNLGKTRLSKKYASEVSAILTGLTNV
ncbi:HEAT repeat domain-containing protein [Paenibacillus sp. sgz500958]|uniref:HEAT repeat domain-containing protein n=1 Tax=Paenibacillus sp. sgz500958 TaxID=3242475 RepID=UPI0036D3873B